MWLIFLVILIAVIVQNVFKIGSVEYVVNGEEGLIMITGCSSGIGRYLCERLGREYPDLEFACTVRKEKDREMLITELSDLSNIHVQILDITSDEHVDEISKWVKKFEKPLVGLINNAGRSEATCPIELMDLKEMQSTFEVNVFGTVKLTKAMLPFLRRTQGRVITVGSIVGALPAYAGGFSYTGTKRALESFTDSLRQEMRIHGVSVSLLQPGTVQSQIFENMDSKERLISKKDLNLYPHVYGKKAKDATRRVFSKADPPQVLMPSVRHALFDPYPQTRYAMANLDGAPVGFLKFLFWLLPDRLSDVLMGA